MKAKINGVEVEGTADEFKQLLFNQKTLLPKPTINTETKIKRKTHKKRKGGRKCKIWTNNEKDICLSMLKDGFTISQISSKLGRTKNAITAQKARFINSGDLLRGNPKQDSKQRWTLTDDLILIRNWGSGMSLGEVSKELNISKKECIKRLDYLRKNKRLFRADNNDK